MQLSRFGDTRFQFDFHRRIRLGIYATDIRGQLREPEPNGRHRREIFEVESKLPNGYIADANSSRR